MDAHDLDRAYSALCEAMDRVGEEKTPLLLAMVSLSLMARQDSAEEVLSLIRRAATNIGERP